MGTHRVIYVHNWDSAHVHEIRDDVMLPLDKGIYFHHRLQLLIVVKDELLPAIAAKLP